MTTPISIEVRILTREESADVLTSGLQTSLPTATRDAVEKILDALSRRYILLVCPVNEPFRLRDDA